jgi:hypothetical protein
VIPPRAHTNSKLTPIRSYFRKERRNVYLGGTRRDKSRHRPASESGRSPSVQACLDTARHNLSCINLTHAVAPSLSQPESYRRKR